MGMLYDVFYYHRPAAAWICTKDYDPSVTSAYLDRITLGKNEQAEARNINGDGHVIVLAPDFQRPSKYAERWLAKALT
jgi:hypothetical protein